MMLPGNQHVDHLIIPESDMSGGTRMIVDIHVHTHLSDDSKTTPEKYVEAAIKSGAGLGAICFTEHRKFPRDPEIDRIYAELSDNHGILIIKGVEADTDLGHLSALRAQ